MAGIEQGGHFDKYQLAKEVKDKLIGKANNVAEEDIQKHRSLSYDDRFSPGGRTRIVELAMANKDQLEATVNEIPELKAYLERVGSLSVTREYLPRLARGRGRISLTSEGVVHSHVRKGADVFPLPKSNFMAWEDGAYNAFASLSPKQLLERVAQRIDPDTTRNKLRE